MPTKNPSLHGNAPDKAGTALLLIDLINDLDFPEGEKLLEQTLPAARNIRILKDRARHADIPAIYVNDNFGRWRSDFSAQVDHCLQAGCRGRALAEMLAPKEDDYFVLKPKHSGFYCTVLEILLDYLGATTVILTGIAGNNCVLFTANDAFLRDLRLFVPHDCVASNTENDNRVALQQMERILKADTRAASEIDLESLKSSSR
jgi:nicotinamidase-related amidase